MRRSAGTTDASRAEELREQLNALLADDSWFSADRQAAASEVFDEIVVRAFYEDLTTPTTRSFDVREQKISLPTKDDGYCRVLLVGPKGVGKTSLLRQLIGSHPERDRFPSTSASRTTSSDIEVITAPDENYACVATFFNEWTVQTGHCRRGAFTLLGEPGLTFLKDIRCDRLFLTAQAIDTECASDTSWDLVQLKRAMMEAAAATVLVADSSRFGGRALYRVADLEKISAIITDDGLEEEQRQRFTDRGVELTLVPVPEG